MSDLLKFEVADGVATITLNRPEKLNAFTDEMLEDWLAALEDCRTNPEVRVIVMTGTGRAFTTGGDIEGFSASAKQTAGRHQGHGWSTASSACRARWPRSTSRSSPRSTALPPGGGLDIALGLRHPLRCRERAVRRNLRPDGVDPRRGRGLAAAAHRRDGQGAGAVLGLRVGRGRARPSASGW